MSRTILHSDMNCFYASVEMLHHPELAGKPMAVGGDPEARHGIVLTANYIAKRAGVKTGMALWQARQVCPEIIFVPPRMDLYLRFSRMAQEIYSEYTDQREPFGIDESWLDVTASTSIKGDGMKIAKEIGAVCREKGILFHTDAVQAAGHLHINVREQNIDMLSLSGHKFHGPKGVGVLYTRQGIPLTNIIEGGAQERGKRAGTENIPGIVGMAAALREACDRIDETTEKVTALRDKLIAGLSQIPHSVLNGDPVHRLPGNVNLCFEGIEGESLLLLLDQKGICASSGSACTSGSLDPSHVLLAIGRPHEVAHGSLRLSLCEGNSPEEVEYVLREVPRIVEYLRAMSPVWKDLMNGKRKFML